MNRILSALLAALLALTVSSTAPAELTSDDSTAAADLALALLQKQQPSEQNTLLSPLSIIAALGMTANGAAGETLRQMEAVLGLDLDRLNAIMPALMTENENLSLANGIWYRDTVTARPDFLAVCADSYRAAALPTPMDATTREAVNAYIADHTHDMIRDMLDESFPDPAAVMLLVNALAFEAEWERQYTDATSIRTGDFFPADGEPITVEYMHSTESRYLRDDHASGFLKPYADGRYAFAALLPDEGITLDDYIAALDGEALVKLLQNPHETAVQAALPKFSTDFTVELSTTLAALGMPDAFGQQADFSRMVEDSEDVHISRVLHKTHIEVGEAGTRAAAATVVEMRKNGIPMGESVCLDRPFLYMIVDLETALPVFIGTLLDPQ